MWPFKSKKKKLEEQIERVKDELEHDELQFNTYKNAGWLTPIYRAQFNNKINLLRAKLCVLESELEVLR